MTDSQRVLVIGGTGMLGHKVWQVLRGQFDTWVAARDFSRYEHTGLFPVDRAISGVHADDFGTVRMAAATARPSVIVNCVGIVKQIEAASDPVTAIEINALFPQRTAALAAEIGARMIQISTDCVFAGTRGRYTERDAADAQDLYGRTKLLGEVSRPGSLTLRTSFIGRELSATTGLAEWFLRQRGQRVKGYTQALFSGLTSQALARVLAEVIERHPSLSGVYHVSSTGISKYDLLQKLNAAFDTRVEIEPSDEVRIDRTLDGSRFAQATGIESRGWNEMIAEMAADPMPYDAWRRARV